MRLSDVALVCVALRLRLLLLMMLMLILFCCGVCCFDVIRLDVVFVLFCVCAWCLWCKCIVFVVM